MKGLAVAFLILSVPALGAAPSVTTKPALRELIPGRYKVKLTGLMCRACAMALEREFSRNERFADPKADYSADEARFTVTPGPAVKLSELKSIIHRASRRNNLVDFEFVSIRYIP